MVAVPYSSELKRKKWIREGLIQAATKSFWSPYTGNKENSVILQKNDMSAAEGHTIVFDYDGNLSGKAVKNKDKAFGKGEQKKKFSNKLTVDRYRLVADNGDAFDGVEIGDLTTSQHSDSRTKLGDLFTRFKDQAIFDAVQGLKDTTPSHIIDLGVTFGYNNLLSIEEILKQGTGFSTGGVRRPLMPYTLADGRPCWLFIMDSSMSRMLKSNASYQSIMYNADVRGNDNRLIKGVFGKIGQLLLVEADSFFGTTDATGTTWGLNETAIEISGLRKKDAAGKWTGQDGYNTAVDLTSRGVIMGANAVQLGFGKMPDYKLQNSEDFAISSESCLETWMNCQKTVLLAEMDDYDQAKVAGMDFGVIAVDVKTQDVA